MNAILRSLLTVVGVPTLLALVYFGFMASDIYVSEARFAIRSAKSGGASSGLEALIASPIVSTGGAETLVINDFVESQDLMLKVQDRLDIKSHYSAESIDTFSRLSKDASLEEMLEFIRDDELVEITPKSLRMRKVYLDPNERKRFNLKKI